MEELQPAQLLAWYGVLSHRQQGAREGRGDNLSTGLVQRKSSSSLPYSHL